jgi:class 3 adenylate cyclase/tetratricopeptide (TPR) repeat protein
MGVLAPWVEVGLPERAYSRVGMDCPSCGHRNREGARFCASCGASLDGLVVCPSCGAEAVVGASFCDACGRPLARAPVERDPGSYVPGRLAEKIRAGRGVLEGERKQVTVLFADVLNSMDLAEGADPEEWRRIMDRFFAILCEGVHRFEGTVDKFTGDGVMALFGAPIAHEDHAARACHAALGLSERIAEFSAELRRERGLNFLVRLGLNSGEVVVGAIGENLAMEYTAVGHTVGLAQRMEALAEPGKAYLTEHTAALVEGFFDLRDLGEFEVKGVHEPVRVFELAGFGTLRTRLDVSRARGFSRFVGREEELAALESAFAHASEGSGQIVGVVGEAGIGKSRLCYEFARGCRGRGIEVWEGHCVARGEALPLLPLLEFLRSYFGITDRDADRAAREKIAGRMLLLDERLRDNLELVFDFLGVSDPERPAARMDPEARQRHLFETLNRLTGARSERQPAVLMFEDLQWIDSASEAFLENLVEALPGTRTLLIVNFRPEYRADWMQRTYYRRLPLLAMDSQAIDALARELLGDDPSLDGLAERVRERSGGNPFFVEELIRNLAESGSLEGARGAYRMVAPIDEQAVPVSVQAVLAARIDRLPEREKLLLQTAAVIGREFSEPLLRRVARLPEPELSAALKTLVAAELVYQQALVPETEYAFEHQLTGDVACRSMLAEHRAGMHGRVAVALVDLHPDALDELAATISHHFEQAGDRLAAARFSARAAAWAGFATPGEAMRHWQKVRELTDALPERDEARTMGIAARIFMLNSAWRVGASEQEMSELLEEGRKLAEQANDLRSQALLHLLYAASRMMLGDAAAFTDMALEALALARRTGDAALECGMLPGVAWALFVAGRLREALDVIERGLERWRDDPTLGTGVIMVSPYAWGLFGRALIWQLQGHPVDEVSRELDHALDVARGQADVETTGWIHETYAALGWLVGDSELGLPHARDAVEIAERTGSAFSRFHSYLRLGAAHVAACAWGEAAAALERSLEIARGAYTGFDLEAEALARLAEAYLGRGERDRAVETARKAVEIAYTQTGLVLELGAQVTLANVLSSTRGSSAREEIEQACQRAAALVQETGAVGWEPRVREARARLAQLIGNSETYERELLAAQHMLGQIGARAEAARLAAELSPVGKS